MENPRFSHDEFDKLFPGPFASQQDRQEQYDAMRDILEQLDDVPIETLSARQKAEIFRQSWQRPPHDPSLCWSWLALLRQPAVTFALGLAIGCVAMLGWMRPHSPERPAVVQAEPPLTIERIGQTETYQGQILQKLYPKIEHPKVIVEKTPETEEPRRVLQGTLDDGEIYVV